MFARLGPLMYRHRWQVLLISGVFLAASLVLLLRGGTLTTGTIQSLESEEAQHLIQRVLGHPMDTTFAAIFESPTVDSRDQAFHDAMNAALDPLRKDPAVLSVATPDDAPTFLAASMVNGKERAATAFITIKGDVKHALPAYAAVRARLVSDQLAITCTGILPFTSGLDRSLERDLLKAELISIPLALFVLLCVFRTAIAAIVPVAVGALAVVGGVGLVLALSRHTDVAQYTINICSLIGLGVAIDYSLFTVSRYKEELAQGHSYPDALTRAMTTSGRVVAFSGFAVATGLGGLMFFEGSYLAAMGIGGAIVVALAVIFALTFLPALLAVLGPRIHAGPVLRREERSAGAPPPRLWHATASWVMRRPLLVLVPTLALLLFMGTPFLHLKLGALDVRVLASSEEARRGYELLRKDFPEQAANRIPVVLELPTGPALTKERIDSLFDLSRHLAALPGVKKVESLVDSDQPMSKEDYEDVLLNPPSLYADQINEGKKLSVGEHEILLNVLTDAQPDGEEARALVEAIRKNRSAGDGTLVVGGQTAHDLDTTRYVAERMPRAVAFVVGVTFVVLFLLLGSVILPIKAVVMNLVSISGSFGALVWVFQDGHLLHVEPRPMDPALPVLLFCAVFGLSMDYEVLMLSRIRESYLQSHDNTAAVADGLEKTAGLITSAAAIMVVVFGAFSLGQVVVMKAFGFGMALAVAIDATLVRVLLVPATMRLFGHLNWWAPRWLGRVRTWLHLDALHAESR